MGLVVEEEMKMPFWIHLWKGEIKRFIWILLLFGCPERVF